MRHYDGVRLHSAGPQWRASWIDTDGVKRRRVLGSKSQMSKKDAAGACRSLAAQFHVEPVRLKTPNGKAMTFDEWVRDDYRIRAATRAPRTNQGIEEIRKMVALTLGDKRMIDITRNDAMAFRETLAKRYYRHDSDGNVVGGEATVSKHLRTIKAIFARAIDEEIIMVNPFRRIPGMNVRTEPKTRRFVTRGEIDKLMIEIREPWELMIALCYFAGLRASEAMIQQWDWIDFDAGKLTVVNPQQRITTKKRTRTVRLEPELASILAFGQGAKGPILPAAERSTPGRILATAVHGACAHVHGLTFQAMRQTRCTIWHDEFPAHVCCTWLGHSMAVAQKYYLTVPEHHYEKTS